MNINDNMIDPMCQVSQLPLDIMHSLFKYLKADLPRLAQVCKEWKSLIDEDEFRAMIRPANAFGSREWKQYIKVEAGQEPRLPLWAYGFDVKDEYMLTFIPDKVEVSKEDGTKEVVIMDNLEAIGQLVKKPITDLETGYNTDIQDDSEDYKLWVDKAIKEKRPQEKPHWVWIKKEGIGRRNNFKAQEWLAKERKAPISGLIDTVISLFMEYARSKERHFIWDPNKNEVTLVRVNEKTDGRRICIGFVPSGLSVYYCLDAYTRDHVAFASGRKSIGIW